MSKIVDPQFGPWLKRVMQDRGMTQSELARLVGSTQGSVSIWWRGLAMPTAEQIAKIRDFFGEPHRAKSKALATTQPEVPIPRPPVGVRVTAPMSAIGATIDWRFRPAPTDGGRDYGNSNVWSFAPSIDSFVREVLQNSIDAAKDRAIRVGVRFRLIELEGTELDRYRSAMRWQSLRPHLDGTASGTQKLGMLLNDSLRDLDRRHSITLLIVEDHNTTGLTGDERGTGKFAALCRNNLDSNKDGAVHQGGAFGLGKAVLWRASRFATVLFAAAIDEPGSRVSRLRLFGRSDLAWHSSSLGVYAGPGWFGRFEGRGDDVASAYGETELASQLFMSRGGLGTGTSITVVGFHDPSADDQRSAEELAKELRAAVGRNFFAALIAETLEVTVDVESPAEARAGLSHLRRLVDGHEFQPELCAALEAFRTGDIKQELEKPGDVIQRAVTLMVPALKNDHSVLEATPHDAVLLVRFAGERDRGTPQNTLVTYRGPRMVIKDLSLSGLCLGGRPFHAILLAGLAAGQLPQDFAAEEFLRTAEPPSHKDWCTTAELKAKYIRGCKKRLDEFLAKTREVLREAIRSRNQQQGDGPESIKNLFQFGRSPGARGSDRPRVVFPKGQVDEQGRWRVQGIVRFKPKRSTVIVEPVVSFRAETGSGTEVRWEQLAAEGLESLDGGFVVPPGVDEVVFNGYTDPRSHPVDARSSSISLDVRLRAQETEA